MHLLHFCCTDLAPLIASPAFPPTAPVGRPAPPEGGPPASRCSTERTRRFRSRLAASARATHSHLTLQRSSSCRLVMMNLISTGFYSAFYLLYERYLNHRPSAAHRGAEPKQHYILRPDCI